MVPEPGFIPIFAWCGRDSSAYYKKFKRNQIDGCVIQPMHRDADAFGTEGDPRAMQAIRKNVLMFRRQKGPISIWISLAEKGES